MDAANTGQGHQYICYAMAYGNIGILSDGVDAVTRYAFLQPIQDGSGKGDCLLQRRKSL